MRFVAALALAIAFATGGCCQTIRDFFDESQVQNIYLTVAPADWAALQQNYLLDTYYQATFAWNGKSQTVGIRSRGNGSRSPIKPNLDIKIDKYVKKQTFLSINFFCLVANNEDPSMLHERLAFKLFTKMGLPAPRVAPAKLYINGQYFGFYSIVEHEDELLLQRNFGESGGYLYAWETPATYNFEYLGSDPNLYAAFLELKTNQNDPDIQWFVDFVTAINMSSDADFVAAISKYISPQLYLTHAAIENVLGEIDGLIGGVYGMNNFYWYRFQNSNASQLIVWDKDLTFRDLNRDIYVGTQANVLMRRLLAIPAYSNIYMDALDKAATYMGDTGGWADNEITSEYNVIHDAASTDPTKQCPVTVGYANCGDAEFESAVTDMHSFVAQRRSLVEQMLAQAGYVAPGRRPNAGSAAIAAPNPPAAIAAGTLVNVALANVGSPAGTPFARTFSDATLGNVFISVNGVRAPIAALSSDQATIQIPWDIAIGTASIVPNVGGQPGNSLTVAVTATAPAILSVTHGDGTTVSPDLPAKAGEMLTAWTLGLGDVGAYFDPGAAAPVGSLFSTVNVPQISVNGTAASLEFSGLAPGFVGLYQVNFNVPAVPGGTAPLSIKIGGQMATSTIDVQSPPN